MSKSNYYDLLGIPKSATKQQIRKAYRTKAKEFHPDVNGPFNSHMHFLLLKQAYETLMDANMRHVYDMALISNSEQVLTYAQWKEIERRKIQEIEAVAHEAFLTKRALFQQSNYFKSAKILLYIAPIFSYLFAILILFSCVWIMWQYHFMFIFLFLPFLSLSIFLILATPKWIREAKRYF
ncbi:J domain-containing protein [uncultured Cytophaga sp.]|uniref:J domain-containing protein n=1 Tax=uncultured Cytophaga sp. TaxID=160238 RepID=UPI0026069B8F|nr:J domain-containing protein [uncultured Cytophaga sp.]